ncbi:M23 family metallopeptidase [Methylorubrum extorquens]|uniref:M23 family metallopeptidase n=1 Tax=Methylorubrum extorquens TaxID=408 RepID=A0AAX3WB98_METEX|nr:M23 family metallopeptidase [Methylorubrum extorquens]WHQ68597.1 M23 family metallopeptidase [Methylorubrum extorquens]
MALSRNQRRSPIRAKQLGKNPSNRWAWLISILCGGWAFAATSLVIYQYFVIGRQADEAALRQVEHDEKSRALTRRLVGVASYQMLEQDGLAERLTDIITRQVELENREAALATSLERALAAETAPHTAPFGRTEEPARHLPARRGSTADPIFAGKTLREKFDQIGSGLGRVERRQIQLVEQFSLIARARIERVRAALAELPLAIIPVPPMPPPAPSPRPAFTQALASAEASFNEAGRWRRLAESVPLLPPIDGEASRSSNFGLRSDPFTGERRMHAGMDFRSAIGTIVRAAASGRVVVAGQSGGYGTLVEVDHGRGLVTRYAHLSSTNVEVGQVIAAGTMVGAVGSTGRSTGPHLHYETRQSGTPLDPARFLAAGQRLRGAPARLDTPAVTEVPEAAD